MTRPIATEERRLFSRFQLKEGSLLVTGNVVGLLENISLGGLSFQYFHRGLAGLDGSDLEILLPLDHIRIRAGKYELVGTTPQSEALFAGDEGQVRRYHLRFKDFSSEELQGLWRMIKRHCLKSCDQARFTANQRPPQRGRILPECSL